MSKKEEILKYLKEYKRLATSRFCGLLGIDIWYVKKYLEELEKEGKVTKEEETQGTYWSLKK